MDLSKVLACLPGLARKAAIVLAAQYYDIDPEKTRKFRADSDDDDTPDKNTA